MPHDVQRTGTVHEPLRKRRDRKALRQRSGELEPVHRLLAHERQRPVDYRRSHIRHPQTDPIKPGVSIVLIILGSPCD